MTTEKQIEANRQNATHSTGPKTAAGKAAAAQNSTKHGLRARVALLESEDAGEFSLFVEDTYAALKPVGAIEIRLADRWISDTWRLDRMDRIEAGLMTDADISIADLISVHKLFDKASRRQTQELLVLAESGLMEKLAPNPKSDAPAEKTITRVAKTAEGIKSEGTADAKKLKDLLAQLCDEAGNSAQEQAQTNNEPRAVSQGKGSWPPPGAVLEGMARSFARNARAFATLARYRTSIENSRYRALHELQRLQALRGGQVVPAPAAIDLNLSIASAGEDRG